MTSIRVILADDHPAIRTGLRYLLDSAADIAVVAEVGDGAAAIAAAREHRPDVVLMDVRMPGTDGITATATITAEHLAEVLVLTTFDLDDYVSGALRAGAAGYLLKSAEPSELLDAVRRVAAGDGVLAPEVTRRVLRAFASESDGASHVASLTASDPVPAPHSAPPGYPAPPLRRHPGVEQLTPRERDVLVALAQGLSNHEIATTLYVSPATAKTHVSRVLAKLQVTSRLQAALIAQDLGLTGAGGTGGAGGAG